MFLKASIKEIKDDNKAFIKEIKDDLEKYRL